MNCKRTHKIIDDLKCEQCQGQMYVDRGFMKTLVGYYAPAPHKHDDNCCGEFVHCENDHSLPMSTIYAVPCPVEDCEWQPKSYCHACNSEVKNAKESYNFKVFGSFL